MKKYREAHKALAMAYVREGRTVAEVSRELSVSESALYGWLAQDRKRLAFEQQLSDLREAVAKSDDMDSLTCKFGALLEEVQRLLLPVQALLQEIKRLRLASSRRPVVADTQD